MPGATRQRPSQAKRPVIRVEADVHRRLFDANGEPDGLGIGRLANRLLREALDRADRDNHRKAAS